MSDQLSSAQQEEYKHIFAHFDSKNAGSIDVKTLDLLMKALGGTLSQQKK